MISDNEPIITKYISVPKDYHSLACGAFLAGIVEAVLDGAQLVNYHSYHHFFFFYIQFYIL